MALNREPLQDTIEKIDEKIAKILTNITMSTLEITQLQNERIKLTRELLRSNNQPIILQHNYEEMLPVPQHPYKCGRGQEDCVGPSAAPTQFYPPSQPTRGNSNTHNGRHYYQGPQGNDGYINYDNSLTGRCLICSRTNCTHQH